MLVSVIIPVFNGEKFIFECLESVKACPSTEMECIIINDGSIDGTEEICRRFVRDDMRFHLISKDNSGVSDSRNRGLAEATGNYIFFLDADDYICADQWQEILTRAAQSDYDMVAYGYYDLFDSGNTKAEQFPEGCDINLALLSTTLLNTCWGKLLRREIIMEHGLSFRKDLKTCEDAIFIIDFVQKSKSFKLSNLCILYYRIHSEGVMHRTGLENKLSDFSALYERRRDYISANHNEIYKKAMYRQLFSVVTDLFRSCAGNRRVPEIRREYKKNLKNPTVVAIMSETKMAFLTPIYKKLEYVLMLGGFHICLAMYFKAKSRLTPEP